MKNLNAHVLSIITIFLLMVFACEEGTIGEEEENNTDELSGYARLKVAAAGDPSVFFQDFNEELTVTQIASDQWQIDDMVWWIPPWNSVTEPVIEDSSFIVTSIKSPSGNTKNEAQTITDFPVGTKGEFIVGYKSTRWKYGYEEDEYWCDSNIGLEIYGDTHQAIVFTYGSLGVFADPTGFCPDNTCMYVKVPGWNNVQTLDEFVGIRITWRTEADNSRTFKIYINDETTPRAELPNVNYELGNLRVRLNANVTDADKLPAVDSDTLMVDYISIKSHLMTLE